MITRWPRFAADEFQNMLGSDRTIGDYVMPNPGLEDAKKAIIQGRLLAGDKPAVIAEEEGVSYSTVSRCKAAIPYDVLEKMDGERVEMISDLIMTQLETGLEGSIAIARQAQDEDWRKSQTAAHLATLYGVITDKSIRLLEASEAAANAKLESTRAGVIDTGSDSSN